VLDHQGRSPQAIPTFRKKTKERKRKVFRVKRRKRKERKDIEESLRRQKNTMQ